VLLGVCLVSVNVKHCPCVMGLIFDGPRIPK
jgi:hypothetical protein